MQTRVAKYHSGWAGRTVALGAIVFAVALTGCDGASPGRHAIERLERDDAAKREVARETRRVLPADAPTVVDLRDRQGCELLLAAAPLDFRRDEFHASLRGADGKVLERISLLLPEPVTLAKAVDAETVDIAERVVDPAKLVGWIDHRISVNDSAIADVELEMPPAGGVWAEPLVSCPVYGRNRPFNVIVVSLDTLRADRLGVYGSTKGLTPALDRFAKQSVLFSNAYTTFPNTLAAHGSLFTGYHPAQHRLMTHPGARLSETAETLAAHFAANGYVTAAFTENAYVSSELGFDIGFDRYNNGPKADDNELFPGVARQTFAQGTDWLRRRPSAPFFLFLHTYEVHTPYTPTWRARQLRLRADNVSYEGEFDTWFGGVGTIIFNRREREFTRAEVEQIERLYDGEVLLLDEVVERFLLDIRKLGLLRDTIVVILSDHGDEFDEHGYLGHGETLHGQVLRIPLIVRVPRSVGRSRRIEEPVSIIDVGATVADLAGLPPFAPKAPGRNLAGWIRGDQRPVVEPAYSELNNSDGSCRDHLQGDLAHCAFGGLAIRDDAHAYIRSSVFGWERLYDLRVDPEELNDIAEDRPDVVSRLRAMADAHEAYTAASALPTGNAELGPDTSEKLKALGYID